MNNFLRCLTLSLVAAGSGLAQEEAAPIITAPAPQMEWTMVLKSGDPTRGDYVPGPRDATSWAYTHSGDLTKIIVSYGAASTREYWRFSHITLCQNVTLHKIDVRTDGLKPPYPCASDGFYGLDNVKPADDQGVATFDGYSCHYFRGIPTKKMETDPTMNVSSGMVRAPSSTDISPSVHTETSYSYEAWFDLKTGLPKAYRAGNRTFVYEISKDLPGGLQLPPEYQSALDEYKNDLRMTGQPVDF